MIKNNILSEMSLMSDAIVILNKSSIKLVIITDKKKLLGTITDGDIRRALLNGENLQSKCSIIMNRKPRIADQKDYDLINKLLITHKHVPVVDSENNIIDIISEKIHETDNYLMNPIVIMAGGEGKRLLPLTLNTPKPLLPLRKKPIIHEIINRLKNYHLNDIYISVYYKADAIKDYFNSQDISDVKIQFLEEDRPLGTAGALSLLQDSVINSPCIIINGDVLTDINYLQLIDYHNKANKEITVCAAFYDIQIPFGTIEIEDNNILDIVEKPIKKYLINAGIYIVNSNVIKSLKSNTSIDMTDIIEKYIKTNDVGIFPMHEQWLDIGSHENYTKARKKD